jgi:hypothetical protein
VSPVRLVALSVAIAVAVAIVASPAAAVVRTDSDDVPGLLDLAEVERSFTNGQSAPRMVHVRAKTYERWTLKACAKADGCSFDFQFDVRRGRRSDVDAFWDTRTKRSGRVVSECRVYERHDLLGVGAASKYHRNVFCSFPRRWLQPERKKRRWRAMSMWGTTLDRAPDRGWYGSSA